MGPETAAATLERDRGRIEQALVRFLPASTDPPVRLHEAMRYALFAGGKRLRHLLVLSGCRTCGGDVEDALNVAAAMEMIHTYSLVHDDLPAMDNDTMRRGKPTTHVVYGEALAILVGDALFTRGFELFAGAAAGERSAAALSICGRVAEAVGSRGMVGGQVLDLEAEGKRLDRAALEETHRMKTGRLITVSVVSGGICAGADEERLAALARYGDALGLAFQVVDDILDVTGSDARLGKSAGKDERASKSTFPALLGLDASREEADRLVSQALAALDGFGEEAGSLRHLARFVGARDH